jgi:hypothetical protein
MLHECRTDEGFTDVGDGLVTKLVGELKPVIFALANTLAAEEL